jgi:hypothetical protein
VLHSLGAASSQESYRQAIDELIGWYCSELRLAFNRSFVLRDRFLLERKKSSTSPVILALASQRQADYQQLRSSC